MQNTELRPRAIDFMEQAAELQKSRPYPLVT